MTTRNAVLRTVALAEGRIQREKSHEILAWIASVDGLARAWLI